jgi:hypothetical protein
MEVREPREARTAWRLAEAERRVRLGWLNGGTGIPGTVRRMVLQPPTALAGVAEEPPVPGEGMTHTGGTTYADFMVEILQHQQPDMPLTGQSGPRLRQDILTLRYLFRYPLRRGDLWIPADVPGRPDLVGTYEVLDVQASTSRIGRTPLLGIAQVRKTNMGVTWTP